MFSSSFDISLFVNEESTFANGNKWNAVGCTEIMFLWPTQCMETMQLKWKRLSLLAGDQFRSIH
jgi:hypothetical protein